MLELPRPASTTSCMHLVSVSKFPPPCARSKKRVRVPKKKAPRSKNIQPNVSAYNNGVPPHPMEARSTKQAHGSKKQKQSSKTINLAVEKNSPGSSTNTCRSKKISPQGPENTQASPPTFFCDPTVDGRNIQTPSIRYNPLAPKVQCYCNLKCVSPNGRKKSNP